MSPLSGDFKPVRFRLGELSQIGLLRKEGNMTTTELIPATGRVIGSSVKISLPAGDLLDLFSGAIIATGKDQGDLNTLTGIYLVSDGESFTATATDRYRLITGKIKASGSPFVALLQNTDAAKVIAALKPIAKRNDPRPISLELGTDELLVITPESTFTFRLLDGTFPPFEHLLAMEPAESGKMAFNCQFLGDLGKIPGAKNKPVIFTFHGNSKLVTFTVAHSSIEWRGGVMPMRYSS